MGYRWGHFLRRLACGVCGCLVLPGFMMSGCARSEVVEEPEPTSTVTTTTTTTTVPTTTAPPMDYNILTGLYDIPQGSSTRPVGIMIANNDRARPQTGLDSADLFVEIETEGAITRIMAIYGSVDRVPTALGPVRSARTPFVQVAQAMDIVYVHAGGSTTALSLLSRINIANINALYYDGTTFWRDATLRASKGLEYSMQTSGSRLLSRMTALGFQQTAKRDAPYTFGEVSGSGAGSRAQIKLSAAQTDTFVYDAATKLYTKYNGSKVSADTCHVTMDGTAIQVSNVVVIYGQKYSENSTTCNFTLTSGSGVAISGGTSRTLTYQLSADGFTLYEADGSKLQLSTGKTYLCIADTSFRSGLVLS